MTLQLYKPDGGFNRARVTQLAVGGTAVAALAGAIYGDINGAHPNSIAVVPSWLGCLFGLGFLLDRGLRWAHNRNGLVAFGLVGLFGAAWFYATWAAFLTERIEAGPVAFRHVVSDPREVAKTIRAYACGEKDLANPHAGAVLRNLDYVQSFLLVGEVGALIGVWIYFSRKHLRIPYYPKGHAWGDLDSPWPGYWGHSNLLLTREKILTDESFDWLDGVIPNSQTKGAISFSRYQCPGQDAVYLTVLQTEERSTKNGIRYEDKPLVQNICLTTAIMADLDELFPYTSGDEEETDEPAGDTAESNSEPLDEADAEPDADPAPATDGTNSATIEIKPSTDG